MILNDAEFGEVVVRKSAWATGVKFSVSTSGRLAMTVPVGTSDFLVRRFLARSRERIRCELPYRLEFWAKKYGYQYSGLRLSHANTRWGSRSSSGTISLNIGLMKLPEPLIDYVILHELAHINHMNHSSEFWREVSEHDPLYKKHRKALKLFSPGV